jgi:hypothetical protein
MDLGRISQLGFSKAKARATLKSLPKAMARAGLSQSQQFGRGIARDFPKPNPSQKATKKPKLEQH